MKPLRRGDFSADTLSKLSGKFFRRTENSKRKTAIFRQIYTKTIRHSEYLRRRTVGGAEVTAISTWFS
jgi:hypothetical protein